MFRVLLVLLLWLTGNYFKLNYASNLITQLLINIMHFLFLFTGSVVNGSVNQSPSNLIKSERDTAELVCEHNISSYDRIFWYKQTLGHDLTLLGYTWEKNSVTEDNFDKKIQLGGDGTKNGSLKILQLEASDSAMYYCAASVHSVMSSRATIQKALKAAVLHN